jgi:RNA polymerase sigma-70 factor (ECF subfamily)
LPGESKFPGADPADELDVRQNEHEQEGHGSMERVERLWIGCAPTPARQLSRPEPPVEAAGTMTAGNGAITALADLDERALVAACLAGTREAFDVIVERHRRSVYQLCYRFVCNHEDASDLAQEVFLRAYRGLKTFKGEATLGTWLYRIGVNACLNRLSARPPAAESLETSEPAVDQRPDPASRLLQDERSKRVRAAIARLPKKQRATLILRVYHELSHQEIATIVGSSVGAVKANFFHALQNLKRILAQDPE